MRRRLAIVGLLGLFLTPIPEAAFGGRPSAHPGGLRLLVWHVASGAQDGQRGSLLTRAIDGGASFLTPGDEGEGHQSPDEAVGGRENLKINDRGPYGGGKGRIIDLSEAAAKRVGLLARGTERVQVVVVENAS